jgi:pimeloyl-ACP methyl ester carboxylesterase
MIGRATAAPALSPAAPWLTRPSTSPPSPTTWTATGSPCGDLQLVARTPWPARPCWPTAWSPLQCLRPLRRTTTRVGLLRRHVGGRHPPAQAGDRRPGCAAAGAFAGGRAVRVGAPEQWIEQMRPMMSLPDRTVFDTQLAGAVLADWREGLTPEWTAGSTITWRRSPLGRGSGGVWVPVSLWFGEQDWSMPAAHGRWLAHAIPGAQLRLLPDEGHFSLLFGRYREVLDWHAGPVTNRGRLPRSARLSAVLALAGHAGTPARSPPRSGVWGSR